MLQKGSVDKCISIIYTCDARLCEYLIHHRPLLEMCSVSTNGERASQAIALASSPYSLSTKWVCFSWKFDRPNPFGANLGTLFRSYTWRFYFLTEPKLTAHHIR